MQYLVDSMPGQVRDGLIMQGGPTQNYPGGFNVLAAQCIFIHKN